MALVIFHQVSRRLKLMHVVPSLCAGGMENGVANLCNRLDSGHFAPSICVLDAGGAVEARVNTERVELFQVRRWFGNDPTVPFRLARQLRRRRIDILHTHCWGTLVEGLAAAKIARVKAVIHGEHGTIEDRPRNIRVQRRFWGLADQVVAVSAPLADRLARVVGFPRDRIQVISNGVDTERFRPSDVMKGELRQRLGLPQSGFLIGMVARFVPVKNHAGVLHAVAKLREGAIDAHLALAGDGPLRDELRQLAERLQIADHVHFLGELVQVERMFSALDVFVLNSDSEGMSNTVLEAMACGVPVVATGVGANPALLAEGAAGLLVPPRDGDRLYHALRQFAEKPDVRSSLGRAGRRRAEDQFRISSMVESYSQLYTRVAALSQ